MHVSKFPILLLWSVLGAKKDRNGSLFNSYDWSPNRQNMEKDLFTYSNLYFGLFRPKKVQKFFVKP